MADRLRVACVQLNASASKADNLERMETLVARAAAPVDFRSAGVDFK